MTDFDLVALRAARRRSQRPVVALLAAGTLVGAVFLGIGATKGVVAADWSSGILIFIVMGSIVLAIGLFGMYTFLRAGPSTLSLEDTGLKLMRGGKLLYSVTWSDPRLRLSLFDGTSAVQASATPFFLSIGSAWLSTPLPADGYRELIDRARAAGARVTETRYQAGSYAGYLGTLVEAAPPGSSG